MSRSEAGREAEDGDEGAPLSLPSAWALAEAARWGVPLCVAEISEDGAAARLPGALLGRVADKYALTALPQVDCEALIPICGARCCTLTFALSPQDLAEGVLRWDPLRPYHIAHGEDGRCVHGEGPRCGVYRERPAPCRTYDCRGDRRIWEDFDQRILAGGG